MASRHQPLITNSRRQWRQVFRDIIAQYLETKANSGQMSVQGFYAGLAREGGRSGANPRIVRPSPSDFICEVEIVARRVLNISEYEFFLDNYVNNLEQPKASEFHNRVQEKMGKSFIQKRIFPLHEYLEGIDLR